MDCARFQNQGNTCTVRFNVAFLEVSASNTATGDYPLAVSPSDLNKWRKLFVALARPFENNSYHLPTFWFEKSKVNAAQILIDP